MQSIRRVHHVRMVCAGLESTSRIAMASHDGTSSSIYESGIYVYLSKFNRPARKGITSGLIWKRFADRVVDGVSKR